MLPRTVPIRAWSALLSTLPALASAAPTGPSGATPRYAPWPLERVVAAPGPRLDAGVPGSVLPEAERGRRRLLPGGRVSGTLGGCTARGDCLAPSTNLGLTLIHRVAPSFGWGPAVTLEPAAGSVVRSALAGRLYFSETARFDPYVQLAVGFAALLPQGIAQASALSLHSAAEVGTLVHAAERLRLGAFMSVRYDRTPDGCSRCARLAGPALGLGVSVEVALGPSH